MFLIGVEDEVSVRAHLAECRRIVEEPSYKDLTLIVDGTSMSHILDTAFASAFVYISLQCHAVLCCRLSPIQKAKVRPDILL
jgi:magnesium-transporting ATPase (P-type)